MRLAPTLFLLLLSSCLAQPPTMAEQVRDMKEACLSACSGVDASASLSLPAEGDFTLAGNEICVTLDADGKKLYCGTCPCAVVGDASFSGPGGVTCVFVGGVNATCSLDVGP